MPERFVCRLSQFVSPAGTIRVRYAPPDTDGAQPLVIVAPEVVVPPSGELTHAEFADWLDGVKKFSGPHIIFKHGPDKTALVTAARTFEDEILPGQVRATLDWLELDGARTVVAVVECLSDLVIPRLSLAVVTVGESLQSLGPKALGMLTTGATDFVFEPAPDWLKLQLGIHQKAPSGPVRRLDEWHMSPDDLGPGRPRAFVLLPEAADAFRSRGMSLSRESHYIAVCTDGYEFDRIGGDQITDLLMREPAGEPTGN